MSKYRDLFDRVVCVTLGSQPQYWEQFQLRLSKANWPFRPVERFLAIDGRKTNVPIWWFSRPGVWGCYRSHVRILEDALNEGLNSILVLEDDCLFVRNFGYEACRRLDLAPKDWDQLYFGGSLFGRGERSGTGWVRAYGVTLTHAYAIRGKFIETMYRYLTSFMGGPGKRGWCDVDQQMALLQEDPKYKVYLASPKLALQTDHRSETKRGLEERPPILRRKGESLEDDIPEPGFYPQKPLVAILGAYRSGASCIAGVLHHLGVFLGHPVLPADRHNPQGYFEPVHLRNEVLPLFDANGTELTGSRDRLVRLLSRWFRDSCVWDRQIALKMPILCLAGPEVEAAWEYDIKWIAVDRPVKDAASSLARLEPAPHLPQSDAEQSVERLRNARDEFLSSRPHVRISYDDFLLRPQEGIRKLVEYLDLDPTPEQVQKALRSITMPASRRRRTSPTQDCKP